MICRYWNIYTITGNKRLLRVRKQGIDSYNLLVPQLYECLLIPFNLPAESMFENYNKYSTTSKNHIKITILNPAFMSAARLTLYSSAVLRAWTGLPRIHLSVLMVCSAITDVWCVGGHGLQNIGGVGAGMWVGGFGWLSGTSGKGGGYVIVSWVALCFRLCLKICIWIITLLNLHYQFSTTGRAPNLFLGWSRVVIALAKKA